MLQSGETLQQQQRKWRAMRSDSWHTQDRGQLTLSWVKSEVQASGLILYISFGSFVMKKRSSIIVHTSLSDIFQILSSDISLL